MPLIGISQRKPIRARELVGSEHFAGDSVLAIVGVVVFVLKNLEEGTGIERIAGSDNHLDLDVAR